MNKKVIRQVAKVIGKKLAVHELRIAGATRLPPTNTKGDDVYSAFVWDETPQGSDFWYNIDRGKWPYNYERY